MTTAPTGAAGEAVPAGPHIDPAVAWQEMTTHNRILESRCLVLAQQLHEARAALKVANAALEATNEKPAATERKG